MQEVWWKGNEHLDATHEIYISYIYHKLPVIYIYFTLLLVGGGGSLSVTYLNFN